MRNKLPWTTVMIVVLMALVAQPVMAQVPGQVPLNPTNIPQFVDPLPHFAGVRVNAKAGGALTVQMVPHTQRAVSTGTKLAAGATGLANLWVYQISYDGGTFTAPNWPAWTIEADRDITGAKALHVTYQNLLGGQRYSDVGLVPDQTLHSALPMLPATNLNPYTGSIPTTVHLHGGEVPPLSDGGPDSWFMPGGTASPDVGHSFNSNPYLYPNTQEGATLWYHDHALGVTRLNVYAGLAGFYLLRETGEDALHLPGWSGDGTVQEVDPVTGVLARGPYLPEIEIVIQDRMFDNTGKLYYPNLPTNPADHPWWTPEFVGDVITVNGKTWPYLSVAPRAYRFRLLNGSNARFYNLSFPKGGPQIWQIGTDGGFLDAAVPLANGPLLIAPGERADVIIDFAGFGQVLNKKGKLSAPVTFVLGNDARTPFPGGAVVRGNTTGRIMQFVVNGKDIAAGATPAAPYTPPALRTTPLVKLTDFAAPNTPLAPVVMNRQLTLNEVMGAGGPLEVLVNNAKWMAPVTENPTEGTTEIWKIINLTADAHPIHLHLVQFQLMSRQPFNVAAYTALYDGSFTGGGIDPMTGLPYPAGVFMGGFGPPLPYLDDQTPPPGGTLPTYGGNPDVTPYLLGAPLPANPNEKGWKDTFIMYPGEVTTVIARWAPTDADIGGAEYFAFSPNGGHGYVWHCHIIDHEDNEMMRPYNVIASAAGNANRTFGAVSPAIAANTNELEKATDLKPVEFGLDQNFPNPFNPTTEIRFGLPEDSHVLLKLYNALGQEVQTLLDSDAPAGNHTVKLDASKLSSGTYFYRLQAGSYTSMKKMMLVK